MRGQIELYQEWIDHAQKRYLAALKTLAHVRRLLVPMVQVTVAKEQVSVGTVSTSGRAIVPE